MAHFLVAANPPLGSLLLLFFAPIGVAFFGRWSLIPCLLLTFVLAWMEGPVALAAGTLACLCASLLALLKGRGFPIAWGLALWAALCTLPLWGAAPPTASAGTFPAWCWWFWPAAGLPVPEWDPLRSEPLYVSWGSVQAMPEVQWLWQAGLFFLASVLLYFWRRPGDAPSRPPAG